MADGDSGGVRAHMSDEEMEQQGLGSVPTVQDEGINLLNSMDQNGSSNKRDAKFGAATKGKTTHELTFLPQFASDEVKELNAEVFRAEKALRDLEEAIEEQHERASVMEDHMKRVQQEIKYGQLRADAKRREIETEENLFRLSEMETSRLQRDMSRMEKETGETMDRLRSFKSSISKANQKIEQFRLLMQWNQEELEQWSQAGQQKDEDNMALESYTKTDNAKLKELYLELEKAATSMYNLQQELDSECTATQSAQIQLNRTAEVYRDLHIERQNLVSLWENTVEAIHSRDESIHKVAENFAENKASIREKKKELDRLAIALSQETEKNVDLDKNVEMVEDDYSALQERFKDEIAKIKDAENELELLKTREHRASLELALQLAKRSEAEEELTSKKISLDGVEKKLASLKRKFQDEILLLDTLDKKRHELESILASEENNLKIAKKEVGDLRLRFFEESEKLNKMKAQEKDIVFEIHGAKSQSKSLTAQIHQLELSMMKQEEVLYTAEFQIQILERKVARAGGERTDVETRELNEKISALEKELEDKKCEETIVLAQLKKSTEDRRAAKRREDDLLKRVTQLDERNAEIKLEAETGLRTVKDLVKQKEEQMLARDLLQMEVNRLQDILNLKADMVYGMENAKQRLQMSMEERKREIAARQDQQRLALRALQEDLHFLMLKRRKLLLHVHKLQSKYEIILRKVKIVEEQERSPNYYIIKAAQEREMLQQEGYALEQEVEKVQVDVAALENAVKEIKDANNLLRHSYKSNKAIHLEDEQARLKVLLESVILRSRMKENEEQIISKEVANMEESLENREKEKSEFLEMLKDLQKQEELATKDEEKQSQKQRRATIHFQRLSKDLKGSLGEDAERVQKEMQLVELKETTTDVLYKLKALIQENPDVAEIVQERIIDAGFKMPSNTSSVRSSLISSSSRGSISSRSSIHSFSRIDSIGSARSSRSGSVVTMEFTHE